MNRDFEKPSFGAAFSVRAPCCGVKQRERDKEVIYRVTGTPAVQSFAECEKGPQLDTVLFGQAREERKQEAISGHRYSLC